METIILAKLWGPVLLAVGLGIFVSRRYYVMMYRRLEQQTLAVLVFAMAAIPAGIAQIIAHNVWGNAPEAIISALGWGLLAKGIVFAVAPGFVDKAGDWEADSKLIPVAGLLTLALGAYLSWFGYLAFGF